MKVKLMRDKVISLVGGKDLVGVYYLDSEGIERLVAEVSPTEADRLIKLWNTKNSQNPICDAYSKYRVEMRRK